jgi:ribosome-binding factor A
MRLLLDNRKTLQAELARRVTIKRTPILRFHDDRTPEQADRVLQILDELGMDSSTPDEE